MLCNDNPNKWKKIPNKTWDNKRRKTRGRGNRVVPDIQYRNPVHVAPNQQMMPQNHYIPDQQMLKYPQQPIYSQPMWDKKGNEGRYNMFPPKK